MWKSVLIAAALTGGCGVMSPPNELASAARAGRLEQIDALIRRGADINQPSGVNGWTPVVHAIHKGQIGALRRLVDLGASLDGEVGRRALMMAGGYGEEPTVRFLLAHGVTPRADGDGGAGDDRCRARRLGHRLPLAWLRSAHRRGPRTGG